MATSAFKSTTRRPGIGASSSSDDSASSTLGKAHRRSRSLSRFSRRLPEPDYFVEPPISKGKRFVNTDRGSDFLDISLDDLAAQLFSDDRDSEIESAGRGRPSRRDSSTVPSPAAAELSQRRGRSVTRQKSSLAGDAKSGVSVSNSGRDRSARHKSVTDHNSRRRRSLSVARHQIGDSEASINNCCKFGTHANQKTFGKGNTRVASLEKSTALNNQQILRRASSQKDLSKLHEGYSSQSSALTDDEARDTHFSTKGIERTIRAVYAQNKMEHPTGDDLNGGFYETMRKELRHAVNDIRKELEQTATVKPKTSFAASGDYSQSDNSGDFEAVSTVIKNYALKLEQSEKRKQDLLAEILLEEEHSWEVSKIVKDLLPDSNNAAAVNEPFLARKSRDRNKLSKRLTEEAEKYFEDFLSNIDDTDISSFDGERSDASSTLGGIPKSKNYAGCGNSETSSSLPMSESVSIEMDGVILPWLQWETTDDGLSLTRKIKSPPPVTPKTLSWDALQVAPVVQGQSNYSASSRGSCSPGDINSPACVVGAKFGESGSHQSHSSVVGTRRSGFDMDEYYMHMKSEDLLFESYRQRNIISSGGLILCNKIFL